MKTDNRWSPGASGATVPETTPAAYSARWIDRGDHTPAEVLPDRQGFAYNDEATRQILVDLMSMVDLRTFHHGQPADETTHVADDMGHDLLRPRFQCYMRRAGGYVYVDAWLTPPK
jgi:hypothetical protein